MDFQTLPRFSSLGQLHGTYIIFTAAIVFCSFVCLVTSLCFRSHQIQIEVNISDNN